MRILGDQLSDFYLFFFLCQSPFLCLYLFDNMTVLRANGSWTERQTWLKRCSLLRWRKIYIYKSDIYTHEFFGITSRIKNVLFFIFFDVECKIFVTKKLKRKHCFAVQCFCFIGYWSTFVNIINAVVVIVIVLVIVVAVFVIAVVILVLLGFSFFF